MDTFKFAYHLLFLVALGVLMATLFGVGPVFLAPFKTMFAADPAVRVLTGLAVLMGLAIGS